MPTIKFHVKKKSGMTNLYIRFAHGKLMDLWCSTNIFVNAGFWDHKSQRLRSTKQTPMAIDINNTIDSLKIYVMDRFSLDYSSGAIIDKKWLENLVSEKFNRPKGDKSISVKKHLVYFSEFIEWWLNNKSSEYRNERSKKKLSKKRIGILVQYGKKIKLYENENKTRITINSLSSLESEKIMAWIDIEKGYSSKTIKKYMTIHNFFLDRIVDEKIRLPEKSKCFYEPSSSKKVLEPYLDEKEILRIFNADFSDNESLDNARDNFIIGLRTGLRVSDFLSRLRIDNISNGFIEIETKKTNKLVAIPLHWMVQKTLDKRLGMLPTKTSDQKFNKNIKKICSIVGITNEIEGYLYDSSINRKKLGIYPKYKLVSSHICRRSFATNLYGQVPNHVIMAVGGWSSETVFLNYIKKTNIENAKALKEYWDKEKPIKPENNNETTINFSLKTKDHGNKPTEN